MYINDSSISSYTEQVAARIQETNGILGEANVSVDLKSDLIPGIKITGKLNVKIPKWKFEYIRRKNSLLPEKVHIQMDMNTEGTSVSFTQSKNDLVKLTQEKLLHSFPLPPITIIIPIPTPVGIFPFPLRFGHAIAIKTGPIELTGKFIYNFPYAIYTTLGTKYENGNWVDISSFKTAQLDTSKVCRNNFSASVSLTSTIIKAEYELKPFNLNLLKATLGIAEKVEFKVQTVSPEWSLKAFANISGSVKTDFFTGEKTVLTIGGSTNYFEQKIEGNLANCDQDTAALLVSHGTWTATTNNGTILLTFFNNGTGLFKDNINGTLNNPVTWEFISGQRIIRVKTSDDWFDWEEDDIINYKIISFTKDEMELEDSASPNPWKYIFN